jgi:hypothetical protein
LADGSADDAPEDAAPGGAPPGGAPPGGGPPGGGPAAVGPADVDAEDVCEEDVGSALATAGSSPLASSDAESWPSPLVSRLVKAAPIALDDAAPAAEESVEAPPAVPVDDGFDFEALAPAVADRMFGSVREPFEPNWLIRVFARPVAAWSRSEVEPDCSEVSADKVAELKRPEPLLIGEGPVGGAGFDPAAAAEAPADAPAEAPAEAEDPDATAPVLTGADVRLISCISSRFCDELPVRLPACIFRLDRILRRRNPNEARKRVSDCVD